MSLGVAFSSRHHVLKRKVMTDSAQRSMTSLTQPPGVRIESDVKVTSYKRLKECHVESDWIYSMWYKGWMGPGQISGT